MNDDAKEPLGRCCYGGAPKPKRACGSCAAWRPVVQIDPGAAWPFPAKREGAVHRPAEWPAAPADKAQPAATWPHGEDWLQQIVYALERQERALRAQADALHDQRDYSAELPAEDADRIREAVALLGLVRAGWEQAAGGRPILRADVQFLIGKVTQMVGPAPTGDRDHG